MLSVCCCSDPSGTFLNVLWASEAVCPLLDYNHFTGLMYATAEVTAPPVALVDFLFLFISLFFISIWQQCLNILDIDSPNGFWTQWPLIEIRCARGREYKHCYFKMLCLEQQQHQLVAQRPVGPLNTEASSWLRPLLVSTGMQTHALIMIFLKTNSIVKCLGFVSCLSGQRKDIWRTDCPLPTVVSRST